jgi:AmmeMemoRadiSam system protein A
MISPEEQRELLLLAREAITCALTGVSVPRRPPHLPGLAQRCGLFVTLKQAGELRGCIGHIESLLPLGEVVGEIAVMAALEDPRFSPVTSEELAAISVQISVLSPFRRIHGPDEVVVGTHGILLELGGFRGLLLPQVAPEFGWTAVEFLEATARKAGLPRDAWQDACAKLSVFTAEVFEETGVLNDTTPDHSTV